jgi:hypothetical protein
MIEEQPTKFTIIDQVMKDLKDVMQKIETIKADLERVTAQRNQLEAYNEDMQEYMNKEIAVRDNEIDRLKHAFQREMAERKATADLLLNSFSQIQKLMNSVKQNVSHSDSKDQ